MAPHTETARQEAPTEPRTVEGFRAKVQALGAELDQFILDRERSETAPARHALEDARMRLMQSDGELERAMMHHKRRRPTH
jgi:hypothetical protein